MPIKTHKLRRREEYAHNASKLHKAIGELLGQSIFTHMVVFQEYPVEMINPDCPNSRMKVDWYIKTLNIAIEVQGQHHFDPVQYGGQSEDKANNNFVNQVHRDVDKSKYLEAVGCPIIEVHYSQKLSLEWLIERISDASKQNQSPAKTDLKLRKPKVISKWKEEAAEKRRAYQREQYKLAKERRKR